MSTKTTFKRIALVAVAALGLGMLSVVPSSAIPNLTVTIVNGTAGLAGVRTDSTTAGTITVAGYVDGGDSVTISLVAGSFPIGGVPVIGIQNLDSTTSQLNTVKIDSQTAVTLLGTSMTLAVLDTSTAPVGGAAAGVSNVRLSSTAAANISYKLGVQLDSATSTRPAGTYNYTVVVKTWNANAAAAVQTTYPISITIAAGLGVSTTVDASKSFAKLTSSSTPISISVVAAVDASIASVATAGTIAGYVYVGIRNTTNTNVAAALDSITATTTVGLLTSGGVSGKSLKLAAAGDLELTVSADGTAGVASITIATNGTTYAAKTVTFYAKSAKTITAKVLHPVLAVGANAGAISVAAVDANGTAWTGAAYIYASTAADALIGGSLTTPVACDGWNSTDGILCPITTLLAGTAKFKIIDAATVALATATSNEVTVTVSSATAATVKLAFDKATYGPNEKAFITVTPLDSAGKTIPGGTLATLLATGGITSSLAFTSGSDTLTAVSITTSALTGSAKYTVYMPAQGTVTITATGGASLPLAGQVAVTATATAVNAVADALSQAAIDAGAEAADAANAATDAANAAAEAADAATAAAEDATDAVAALATQVATLVAGLKAQLTALTNLIIKIQRSVNKLQN